MFKPIYIIGFSGNRPNGDPGRTWTDIEAKRPAVSRALDQLEAALANENGVLELFSSAAEGADTIACEVAMERRMALHLILPKVIDAFMEDFAEASDSVIQRTRAIIRYAQSGENGSTFRVAAVSGSGSACYEVTNTIILESADAMLFLWNGVDTGKEGGAGELLRQTRALEKPHVVLNTLDPAAEARSS